MFAVAFAVRGAYAYLAVGRNARPFSDAITYHEVARNLATLGRFAVGDGPVRPTAFIPPVMPFLTSLVYRVTGPSYFAGILLQCALGALVPLAVVRLGAALYDSRVGRAAGWLSVFHPILISFSGYMLTEASFTLTLTIAVLASVEWAIRPTGKRALAAGAGWGLATLTRPTVLIYPAIIILWGWACLHDRIPLRAYARQAILIGGCAAVLIAPWTLRNAVVMDAFIPVTTGAGNALFDSNNPAKWNDSVRTGGACQITGLDPYASKARGLSEVATDKLWRAEAVAFLRAHIREWPEMAVAKVARFWRLSNEGQIWAERGSPLIRFVRSVDPLLCWSIIVLPLAVWGLIRSLRGPLGRIRWLLPITILFFTALAAVFWGGLRPRVPIEPLVALLATAGFFDIAMRVRRRA